MALGLTALAGGPTSVVALLRRLVDWEVPARWYVFAAGYMLAIKLTAALVHRMAFGEWLYSNTRGSLLPVMLLHAAVNNTNDIVPSADAGATNPWALSHSSIAWVTLALMWLCAGYFLIRMRRAAHRPPAA